jgi:hypothetical protein
MQRNIRVTQIVRALKIFRMSRFAIQQKGAIKQKIWTEVYDQLPRD